MNYKKNPSSDHKPKKEEEAEPISRPMVLP